MGKGPRLLVGAAILIGITVSTWAAPPGVDESSPAWKESTQRARLDTAYGQLPLSFEANKGQVAPEVDFLARGNGHVLFLDGGDLVLVVCRNRENKTPKSGPDGANTELTFSNTPLVTWNEGSTFGYIRNVDFSKRLLDPTERFSAISWIRAGVRPNLPHTMTPPRARTEWARLRLHLVGANPNAVAEGVNELPGKMNYFAGKDPKKWHTNIPTYGAVRYREVYPGIDVIYYGVKNEVQAGRRLEFDFVVSPNADSSRIVLAFDGLVDAPTQTAADTDESAAPPIDVAVNGDLRLHSEAGNFTLHSPVMYQESEGCRHEVTGRYTLSEDGLVQFGVVAYDRAHPLVIDPFLSYATYLGGTSDEYCDSIAIDNEGCAYVAGYTYSLDFPVTEGAFQFDPPYPYVDLFVAKLNHSASALEYSAVLGCAFGGYVAVDAEGSCYVTGWTESDDFPTTPGAFRTEFEGDGDGLVFKLDPSGGALEYSTFLGGVQSVRGIAVGLDGCAVVTGETGSPDFPTTPNALPYEPIANDKVVYVTQFNSTGTAQKYSTCLCGSSRPWDFGCDVAVDREGKVYVLGLTATSNFLVTPGAFQTTNNGGSWDNFVVKIDSSSGDLIYGTYLGGSETELDFGHIVVDDLGNAYVATLTRSDDFPVTAGALSTTLSGHQDAVIAKLNSLGTTLLYSTYLGGSSGEERPHIGLNDEGKAYVCGFTRSSDFPVTPDGLWPVYTPSHYDGSTFFVVLDPLGTRVEYGTFITAHSADVSVDSRGDAYLGGYTDLTIETTEGAYQTVCAGQNDAFVMKFCFHPAALSTSVTGQGTIDPTEGTHICEEGETISLTATPAVGWTFDHWEGDAAGTEPTTSVTMDGDKQVTAVFRQLTFTLTVNVNGNGGVEPAEGVHSYPGGTTATVTAKGDWGYSLDHWEGDLSGSENPVTLLMDSNKTVTAVFDVVTYKLTVEVEGGGAVNPPAGTHTVVGNTDIALTAQNTKGWSFVRWEGDVTGTTNPATVSMNGDKRVKAVFESVPIYWTLTMAADGKGRLLPGAGEFSYLEGTPVAIRGTPARGWEFDHWEGALSGTENPTFVWMTEDRSITAVFNHVRASEDINADGVVNAIDVQLVIASALNISTGYDCDVNEDGVVNAVDIQRVIAAVLGLL